MKRFGLAVWILVLFLLLAACAPKVAAPTPVSSSGTPASTPLAPASTVASAPTVAAGFTPWGPWDEIVAGAKREGKLTVYVAPGHGTPATQQAWSQIFQEKFGINVEWVQSGAATAISRVLTEQQTKTYVADVLLNGYGTVSDALVPQGYLQPILAPSTIEKDIWRVQPDMLSAKERLWLYLFIPVNPAAVINTSLVNSGDEPKSYQDFLDPKWKGKITMMTPAQGGSGSGWFRSNYRVLGLDYMRKLAQQVVIQSTTGQEVQAVARGQFPIAVGPDLSTSQSLISKGSPIKFLHLKEGDYAPAQGIYFVSNAPHPNAAKFFINWAFTQEGQTFFSKSQEFVSLRKDVPQDWISPDVRFDPSRPLLLTAPEDTATGKASELTTMGKQIFEDLK